MTLPTTPRTVERRAELLVAQIREQLGREFRDTLHAGHVRLAEIARRMGVPVCVVAGLIEGTYVPTLDRICRFAVATGQAFAIHIAPRSVKGG